jgi:outer membrane lipoprotein-sorting protein
MRWWSMLMLVALTARPAVAEHKEAEKLFQKMDNELRSAKTLRCRFDSTLTAGHQVFRWLLGRNSAQLLPLRDEKLLLKGTLTLGEDDKLRLESEARLGDKAAKVLFVSDGTRLSSKDSSNVKEDQTKEVPKALGAHARVMLPRYGIGILWNSLNRPSYQAASPALDQVSEFKLGVKEEVGRRRTQQIEYTVTRKIDVLSPPRVRVKVWIDLETGLPVKLTTTQKDADITATTETYDEFRVDGKVDEKSFQLPK